MQDKTLSSGLQLPRQKQAPTMVDVARRAGVSKAAVSAVMSRSKSTVRVSDGTRQRIMDAVKELKYQPNVLAQGLNGVRLKSLGISFPTTRHEYILSGHYSLSILRGILDASYEAGYNATVFHRPWHGAGESAAGFRSQGIDGFLVVAPLAGSDMVSGLSGLGIPLVVISTSADVHNVPSVGVDNGHGVRLVLQHLHDLGHRRIAHLYLDAGFSSFDSAIRRDCFIKSVEAAGLKTPDQYLRPVTGSYIEDTARAVRALIELPEPPSALFTTNDTLARHAIDTLIALGVSVPDDFSVVGFDDIPDAIRLDPQLTTVRQPLVEMGVEATRLLISILDGKEAMTKNHSLEPELVVRRSTAPVRR
jgi:LacI family transcriptional regulator